MLSLLREQEAHMSTTHKVFAENAVDFQRESYVKQPVDF